MIKAYYETAKAAIAPYTLLLKILLLAAIVGCSFYAGYKQKSLVVEAAHAKQLQGEIDKREKLQKLYDELSASIVDSTQQNDVVQETIIRRVYVEVEKPVYRECVIPSSGITIQNEQIEQFNKQIRGDK